MVQCAIETVSLTRRLGGRSVVSDISLHVPEGTVYGFLGPNGAGKTTTIRMLLGLLQPDAGDVRLFGSSLGAAPREILRSVGALVEAPSLYAHLTGLENLDITRRLLGVPRAAVGAALETVRLERDGHRRVREYSLGMKQRLGLALALLASPRLLILDEPVNGLDPAGIHEVRGLIRTLVRERGLTVFLSSHLLAEIEQVADRVGIIAAGRLLFEGTLDELRARQRTPQLLVAAEPIAQAEQLLRGAGCGVESVEGGQLRVELAPGWSAAHACDALVRGGCRVSRLTGDGANIEDIFLALTNAGAAPAEFAS